MPFVGLRKFPSVPNILKGFIINDDSIFFQFFFHLMK